MTAPQHPLARRKTDHAAGPRRASRSCCSSRAPAAAGRSRSSSSSEQIAPKVVTETENVEIIKAFVRVGMGVTIIPYQAVAREVRAGTLFCARIAGTQLVRETGWVHLRLNRVPRAVQEMMRTLERIRPQLKLSPGGSARPRRPRPLQRSAGRDLSADLLPSAQRWSGPSVRRMARLARLDNIACGRYSARRDVVLRSATCTCCCPEAPGAAAAEVLLPQRC